MQGLAFALEFDGRLGKALNIWEIFMIPALLLETIFSATTDFAWPLNFYATACL